MRRFIASAFALVAFITIPLLSEAALAARTETAVPPGGPARFYYDSTDVEFGYEMQQANQWWLTRLGFDGTHRQVYLNEDFSEGAGTISMLERDGTAASGTSAAINLIYLPHGNVLTATNIGTQTLFAAAVAGGLDIGADQTANEGMEIASHVLGATGRPFTVGTDAAFYFEVTFTIADASGTDDFHCGFRKVEATEQAIDDYTDMAALSIITSANPAAVQISTILNNAGTSETDTTDTLADATETTWKILVSAAGVTTFQIDGSAPTATATYTFDDNDMVHPFCSYIHAADVAGAVTITNWKADLQRQAP